MITIFIIMLVAVIITAIIVKRQYEANKRIKDWQHYLLIEQFKKEHYRRF